MTEVLFYQLQRQPLERVLPGLIVRSLERGWRVAVQGAGDERIRALDDLLWTYSDESFLPHGLASQADAADQPVVLAADEGNPNRANIRFLIDNVAEPQDIGSYERIVVLFDGRFEQSLLSAREQWKRCRDAGHAITYWQQTAEGRWEKKA
ncbi:MAG: DNA polymerase III subunit chi [Methylobacteriaceae bacterium]|jgi:DNA polymerase-3 subunit chi|nr:DNA polymerase III subunit chi [Methylobacteriaceae bacterium]